MTTVTTQKVAANLGTITPEQIGKCTKDFDALTGLNFYRVENERGDRDASGKVVEYMVWYDKKGFHCQCPSGKRGFANVTHPSGVCKHCRWAVAASIEERIALAEMAARDSLLIINGEVASKEEYTRVMTSEKAIDYTAQPRQIPAFSILRK
jgi:hypothetical protein